LLESVGSILSLFWILIFNIYHPISESYYRRAAIVLRLKTRPTFTILQKQNIVRGVSSFVHLMKYNLEGDIMKQGSLKNTAMRNA
jgi:hypothetical protein